MSCMSDDEKREIDEMNNWPTCKLCGWQTPTREQPFAQAQAAQHIEESHPRARVKKPSKGESE